MTTAYPENLKLKKVERDFIKSSYSDGWKEGGEYWSDNMRVFICPGSFGVSISIWRDKYRHDGMCVCVNDWKNKTVAQIIKEIEG